MSRPKIIELNKNLVAYAQEVMDRTIDVHNKSQIQVQNAKTLGQSLLARIKARDERRAKAERAVADTAARLSDDKECSSNESTGESSSEGLTEDTPSNAGADVSAPASEPLTQPILPVEQSAAPAEKTDEKDTTLEATTKEEVTAVSVNKDTEKIEKPKPVEQQEAKQEQPKPIVEVSEEKPVQRREERVDRQHKSTPEQAAQSKKDVSVKEAPPSKPEQFSQPTKDPKKKKVEEDRRNAKKVKERGVVMEDEFVRGGKKNRRRDRPVAKPPIEVVKIERATIVGEEISVKLFAEKIGKPVAEIIKKLLLLGIISSINSEIDFDTALLVASEFGIDLDQRFEQTAEDVLIAEDKDDEDADLVKRPPVVTIMGHVDHGKTSLLDCIRKTKVTAGEAGGITQHIGAYTIKTKGLAITFLDTPGHEAFTAMRARGAQATDIAILVVAADDGVMPQTIEAINHAKSANVPILVAINKIDKEGANVDLIKQKLTEYGLVAEEWGGDTIMVPVSAKTKQGIDNLLEMILLLADVQEYKANPNRLAKGTIIEARLDKGRGPVATVLVQNGTLRVHDTIVAGTSYGRIRAMLDDDGRHVKSAGPSMPVEVIGFSEVPDAGDVIYAVEQDKLSRQVVEERRDKLKAEKLKTISKVSLDDLFTQIAEGQIKDLNLVVKADVQGSVEAVRQSLEKLSNGVVRVRVIHGGVGAITETDVMLASASNAIIIGFNVRPDSTVASAAERESVDIRLYRVIYSAIEDITKAMNGMLDPEFRESVLGHAEVRQTFKVSAVGTIAGCYVKDGKMLRNAEVRLVRDGVVVHEGKMSSLKRFKDDIKEVLTGYECGIMIEGFNDLKEGDVIEAYEMVELERD